MRSIRRAAIAGATAASLLLGAASIATAEEEGHEGHSDAVTRVADNANDYLRDASAEIGDRLEADKPADGTRLFGSETSDENQPAWARYMKLATIVSLVGSFFGLVVFPAYNFLVANNLIVK